MCLLRQSFLMLMLPTSHDTTFTTWLLIAAMFLQTRKCYLPCMCQWLSSKAPTLCAHSNIPQNRCMCTDCLAIKYHTVQVPSGKTGGEVHQCGASDPQTPAHSPHCCSEWAGQSNGDDSCSDPINQLKEKLYSRIQNFNQLCSNCKWT